MVWEHYQSNADESHMSVAPPCGWKYSFTQMHRCTVKCIDYAARALVQQNWFWDKCKSCFSHLDQSYKTKLDFKIEVLFGFVGLIMLDQGYRIRFGIYPKSTFSLSNCPEESRAIYKYVPCPNSITDKS